MTLVVKCPVCNKQNNLEELLKEVGGDREKLIGERVLCGHCDALLVLRNYLRFRPTTRGGFVEATIK